MQTESTTYNGWANYETWNVALWLDNDEGTYTFVREQAQVIQAGVADGDAFDSNTLATTRIELADWLKDLVEESAPDLGASMYADLLNAALSDVDWLEIASNILDES